MPGGRLTHQDRRQIADGLTQGLSPTEIAARLNRPLSTVTPGSRPQRWPRRLPGRPGAPGDPDALAGAGGPATRARPPPARRDPEAVGELEEQFITVMIDTGLSRMTARVLAGLYLTDSGSLTAAELTRSLQVSPASISKAIGELERQELIRRERDPRRRRDRYVIDADAWFRGWLASARQNTRLAAFARQGAPTLGATSPAGIRLRDIGDFFDHVSQPMLQAAEQWRQAYERSLRERPPTDSQPDEPTHAR